DVLRPVALGERQVGGRRIGGERPGIGIDAAQLPFPGMPMGVDEPRVQDWPGRADDMRARGLEIACNSPVLLAFDEDIAPLEISNLRIEAHDGAALEDDATGRIDARPGHLLDGARWGTAALCGCRRGYKRRCRKRGAGLEQIAAGFSCHARLLEKS